MVTLQEVSRCWTETLVIGHRGAAASSPENTLASFEAAIRCGAVGVECDVHVSRDGELIVIHDETLDRTTPLSGKVRETESARMKAAGVPTLADYLAVTRGRALSVIELKDGSRVAEKVLDRLSHERMLGEAVVFSFRDDLLKPMLGNVFAVRLAGTRPSLEGCDGIGVAYEAVDEALVREARERRLPVFAWTVPPGPEVDRLKRLGVNFIVTNHPCEVRDQLAR
ncbi:MAG TPA: glycerophosphodiester phosphodiesterase [Fimbriimonas sp.]